jgi:DNA polymerase-3 subunit epsilon
MSLIQARYGADIAAWLPGNALSFDTETTGPNPESDRIVTATCIEVGPDGSVDRGSWLVNPGIEISPGAAAIHGISNEQAQRDGQQPQHVVPLIITVLADAWLRGLPVIVMNASFDLTLVQAEAARLGLPAVSLGPVLDPLVIDRGCEPRRAGKRNLGALASYYAVKQDKAHDSRGDALTAARIVWKQARLCTTIAGLSLAELQPWQAEAHRSWAEGFEQWLRKQGKQDVIDRDWPVRRPKGAA